MDRTRIQVYTDPETRRRVELAATRRQQAVTAYCLEAILQKLDEDDMLEREEINISITPGKSRNYLEDLRQLRQRILADRGGAPLTVDIPSLIHALRAERDDELPGVP